MRLLSFVSPLLLVFSTAAIAQSQPADFPALFKAQVSHSVELTPEQIATNQQLLFEALLQKKTDERAEFYVLVDRNPKVQQLSLFVGSPQNLTFVGAAPVATGNTGRFDYYITPLGVFEHTLMKDFRAEGTRNEHGIKGYGSKGMRIWDFGWYPATRGWKLKNPETTDIRFQMHATDPGILEPKLGQPGSKGCVRVPESLNKFMDRYGVLDYAYEEASATPGKKPSIWKRDHQQTPFSGRYIIVVDTAENPVGK